MLTRRILPLLMLAVLWALPARAERLNEPVSLAAPSPVPSLADKLASRQMLFTGGTALASVPVAFLAARLVGQLSPDLVGAAAPAVLLFALAPAAATAAVAAWSGDGRFWPAFGIGVGTQLVAFGMAVLLDVSAVRPLALAVFSLVDAAVLATLMVASTHWFPAQSDAGSASDAFSPTRHAVVDAERMERKATTTGFSLAF